MRIVHTSDWHLGRTLHGVDLIDHQAAYLDHLVGLVRSEDVDAVLVAGDVYDRAIPPVDAVNLLSDTVARLAEHAEVVLTPGNHDSAIRLGFGSALMRPGVHFRTRVPDVAAPVVLGGPGGPRGAREGAPVVVYALPYLDPDATRWDLAGPSPEDPEVLVPAARSHAGVMSAAMRRVGADAGRRRALDPGLRAVVMAHAFVVGGEASESERDIRVGGVDSVPAGTFGGSGIDYVALGHLHGPQVVNVPAGEGDVSARPTAARYSGSPLAYSFSEMHQKKSTVLLDLDGAVDGALAPELIPAPVPRRLAELRGPLGDLLGAVGDAHVDDWLRVVVTDAARPAELYAQVRARFPHALQIQHQPPQVGHREVISVVGSGRDPLEVAREFVEHVTGAAPDAAEDEALRAALESALASERSA